ncbi:MULTISPECIES: gephyrin-like molybdotransferase Glp [unclassified Leptolyngbya]|uniref:molybdopterin molybdotransferase MoeA n=1 Tax=unclassified Leptolyngbya TaxID=2650499 RepID=UPI001683E3DD|nr:MULTISPECIES: gephyrin-like molybdotransferase Glp [unclassified Leptolyngbya]MBD1910626.1 molybdopterin molybdotransferase MoeA [Leptolyngbya sp. FACHB-8]MBD2154566.1 molybdopterin molybdotransferase MoeA [Leptolyngbya sp. FACHB-16]
MLPVVEAEDLILQLVRPLTATQDSESIDLLQGLGRILSQPILSPLDFPHWDNSAMDGYAVRFADVADCGSEQPAILRVVEEIPAGVAPQRMVQPGEAARILTGAMMPAGADTVVMQEVTRREGDDVHILSAPKPQQFVRHKAEFHRAGELLLSPGTVLNPPEIAVLAAAQCPQLSVYRRLRVAILSTGDELVLPNQPLQPGQIVDSNQYALAAAIAQAGAIPLPLGIVADDPEALRQAIKNACMQADVVISSGGVSVGDYDYVEQILQELGGTLHIRQVAIRPGKPLTVATFEEDRAASLYFGLPGNPVSALVTFWRFVRPALAKMAGQAEGYRPSFVWGRSQQELNGDSRREAYLWGRLTITEVGYTFIPAGGSHSSGNLINLAQTNALAVLPAGQVSVKAGESIQILPIS